MINFDEELSKLHDGEVDISDEDGAILIDRARHFSLSEGFNPVIAYEGDVNSQIITFHCPSSWEKHNLTGCKHKKLNWINLSSGAEGVSTLKVSLKQPTDSTLQALEWEVPPEVFNKSGTIEISISLYDIINGKLAFAWNTPTFSGLSVGASMREVGYKNSDDIKARLTPARNEILTIDLERRNIVAPQGYNYIIANYGEVGTSTVHFQVARYFKNIDLSKATIYIKVIMNDEIIMTQGISSSEIYLIYADGSEGDGILQFDWYPDEIITNNMLQYIGNFSIIVQFVFNDSKQIINISQFNNLKISGNLVPGLAPTNKERVYHIQGNRYVETENIAEIGGIVSLRDNSEKEQELKKNELAAEYDEEGKYIGLKIATEDGQTVTDAPYVFSTNLLENLIQDFFNNNEIIISADEK